MPCLMPGSTGSGFRVSRIRLVISIGMASPALVHIGEGRPWFPEVPPRELPDIDPRLPSALQKLSEKQRAAVVLLFVVELSEREVADALGTSRATVRKHAERGMAKLRTALGVSDVE